MKSMIKELWQGNIIPQEDSRNNSKEMKELLGYILCGLLRRDCYSRSDRKGSPQSGDNTPKLLDG